MEYQAVKSDEAEGTVLSVEAGGRREGEGRSTQIVVQVATPFTVPDVLGKTQEQAEAALADEAGYVADVRWVYTEDMEEGLAGTNRPGRRHEAGLGVRRDGQPGEIREPRSS